MTGETPIKGPHRTHDSDGRQIVQVSFPRSYKTYAYRAPEGVTLAVGDVVRTPATEFSPEGGTARVRRLGSEYARELTDLVAKVEPATIVRSWTGGSRYEHDDTEH
jgi:hypothetical protein